MQEKAETARLISRFASILADEADRTGLEFLAKLLRDAEAEAIDHVPHQTRTDLEPRELSVRRLQ